MRHLKGTDLGDVYDTDGFFAVVTLVGESVVGRNDIQVAAVPFGTEEITEIYAAGNTVYKGLAMWLRTDPVPLAGAGVHRFTVVYDLNQALAFCEMPFGLAIEYQYGQWPQAGVAQKAPQIGLERYIVRDVMISETEPIQIRYFNSTDANQTLPREIRFSWLRVRV